MQVVQYKCTCLAMDSPDSPLLYLNYRVSQLNLDQEYAQCQAMITVHVTRYVIRSLKANICRLPALAHGNLWV
jgi:hypothetical protein